MHAVLPGYALGIHQTEVGLVDQRRGLQCVPRAFVTHVAPRQTPQFVVDQGSQLVQRRRVATAPSL